MDPTTSREARFLVPRVSGLAPIALGAMNFGKRTNRAESERILARALERGVELIDTANVYADGESERVVGRFLGSRRGDVLLATKVGLARDGRRPEGLSRAAIERAIEGSLGRLGVDCVDLYYLHAPDSETPIEETIDAIAELVRRGRIRRLGVSNFASWQVLEIIRLCDERGVGRPRVSQVLYNLLVRQVEIEHTRFAARYAVHLTVYNPLAGGLLTGLHRAGDVPAPGSRFDKNRMYEKRYWSPRTFEMAEAYRALAERSGMSLLELAYSWLAASPHVGSILVGPASMLHLDAALDACARPLDPSVQAEARTLHEALTGTDASYAR